MIAAVAIVAGLIVAVSALGTTLLGVPTTYGSGIDSRLGAQVVRDFLVDQDAEALARSQGDPSAISGRLTGNALVDVSQQISDQSGRGPTPTVSFQPASLTVLRVADPVDASLVIEVQEEGTKSITTPGSPDNAPSQRTISFHGNFWLRADTSGRYLIADQNIQNQASSILPALATIAAALVAVGIVVVLVQRQRRRRMFQSPTAVPVIAASPLTETPSDREFVTEPSGPPPKMVVTTFGGLHVLQGGTDWAQALMSRSVTGFVWLRLLLAAIRDPKARPARDEVARQTYPGVGRDIQLKRLRGVIGKGLREMPAALRDRVLVDPEVMGFRLDDCSVDAIELLAVSAECAGRDRLSAAQASRARRVVQICQGAFLAEFEAIEDLATDHHSTCTGLVLELRELLVSKRVDLSLLIADADLAAGRPTQAIALLEPALIDRSARKDLAVRLAAAYRAAGRDDEATALEARYP